MDTCIYTRIYVYMHLYIYVYMCIYIYIYIKRRELEGLTLHEDKL